MGTYSVDLQGSKQSLRAGIHYLSLPDAFSAIRSGPDGLSSAEATRRLAEYGPNRIQKGKRRHPIVRLLREFFRFFSVILWVAAGLAFVAEGAQPGDGMAHIGLAVIAVILISGAFSFWQEHRMERTLAALQQLLPQQTKVMRNASVRLLPIEQLVPGNVIALEQGDNIPADCRLIEAFGVRLNTATLTGESVAQDRDASTSSAEDPVQARNILLAGTSLVAGEGKALIYATGAQTEFGQIAHLAQTSRTTNSPLRKELARLSRMIAVLAVAIGVLFFLAAAALSLPFWKDLIFAIGIIIAMVPEGLLPTLTLSLVLAAQRMAKRKVLIRNLTSVETLGSATVICTDKTGTLTENRMEVREVFLDGRCRTIADIEKDCAIAAHHREFFACANFCHDVRESKTHAGLTLLGEPMEIALIEMHRRLAHVPPSRRLHEIPFDSSRMRQTVVQEMPDGPKLYCKGAPESVLAICAFSVAHGEARPLNSATRQEIVCAQENMAGRGLRVLAFATRDLPADWSRDGLENDNGLDDNLVFRGLVALRDPPRPEVPRAIATCRDAGVKVIMVTGDHPHTAKAIATEIGLLHERDATVIVGEELRTMSAADLGLALDAPEIIFARVGADQKM